MKESERAKPFRGSSGRTRASNTVAGMAQTRSRKLVAYIRLCHQASGTQPFVLSESFIAEKRLSGLTCKYMTLKIPVVY